MIKDFFDINVCLGSGATGSYRPALTGGDLASEIGPLSLSGALVWHIAQCESSAEGGNRLLDEAISDFPGLYGTWAVLPPQTREQQAPEDFFADMKCSGIRGLRCFPERHRFLLNRTVFGDFLDRIVEKKIPVLFSVERGDISWSGLYAILADYPGLVCIICDTGIWGTDRYFRPLVEAYENVYVETSLLSLGEGVLESFVADYGPERLLFGSGFPQRLPEAAMLPLLHADIADDQKVRIAALNARKLFSETAL